MYSLVAINEWVPANIHKIQHKIVRLCNGGTHEKGIVCVILVIVRI
jgi:hypothetical protein